MGLVSNTTPRPPNIRPNPRKTKRKSCIGPGKFIVRKIKDKKIKFFFFMTLLTRPGETYLEWVPN